jgi:hypothetical protein
MQLNQKYRIEVGTRSDIDGDNYDIYNVYAEGKYLFSCDTEWQIEQGISKRENALQQAKAEYAAAAFLHAHKDSSYLKYPMTSPVSGMGRKG